MGARFLAVFADAPVLFFAVVIGVALTFRIAVGVARDVATPDVVAPTFATGAEPGVTQPTADPEAKPTASTSSTTGGGAGVKPEIGAAAKVQPIGRPAPAHVAPRPRGHGRRPGRSER